MSNLDKLFRRLKQPATRLGFAPAAARAAKRGPVLGAYLAGQSDASAFGAGADLVILSEVRAGLKNGDKSGETATGVRLAGSAADTVALADAGVDFVVFDDTAPLSLAKDEKLGKIFQVDHTWEDMALRSANEVPADAYENATLLAEGGPLTFGHLMRARRLTGQLGKPVLLTVAHELSREDLEALAQAGADGFIVGPEWSKKLGTGLTAELQRLRKELDSLPDRRRDRRDRTAVTLPVLGGTGLGRLTEEPDEDEDE
ncbi:MAG: hypothetical protein HY329_18935 [Chloroflexi bacterium]|nr:hypothetical protein [Chloroflexota bacterium]